MYPSMDKRGEALESRAKTDHVLFSLCWMTCEKELQGQQRIGPDRGEYQMGPAGRNRMLIRRCSSALQPCTGERAKAMQELEGYVAPLHFLCEWLDTHVIQVYWHIGSLWWILIIQDNVPSAWDTHFSLRVEPEFNMIIDYWCVWTQKALIPSDSKCLQYPWGRRSAP